MEYLTDRPAPFAALPLGVRGVGEYAGHLRGPTPAATSGDALRQPKVRRRDFDEVGLGLTVDQAVAGGAALSSMQCLLRVRELREPFAQTSEPSTISVVQGVSNW